MSPKKNHALKTDCPGQQCEVIRMLKVTFNSVKYLSHAIVWVGREKYQKDHTFNRYGC